MTSKMIEINGKQYPAYAVNYDAGVWPRSFDGYQYWYDEAPIEHEATDSSPAWFGCPLCGMEVTYGGGGDRYTEGFAPEAYPESAHCQECDVYHWTGS